MPIVRLRYGAVPVKSGLLIVLISIVCICAVDAEIIGEKWTPVTYNANWSPRFDHTALVFDNKMWVLGGSGGDDVWDSSDGVTWSKATDSAGWLPRSGHSSVVFDNRMWVLGGRSGANVKNDVWYSTDGSTWIQATADANWSPRRGHTTLVYDNKIWVLGGEGIDNGSAINYNDVWYSTDGSTWIQATADANWSPRGGHTALVYNNKMWVLGGEEIDNRRSIQYNDVWYSTEGSTWTQATAEAEWSPRSDHQSVVFGQRMWVLGGYTGLKSMSGRQEVSSNDIWYSYDGKIWYPATDDARWSPRNGHRAVVFQDRMQVLGGIKPGGPEGTIFDLGPGEYVYSKLPDTLDNDVWESVSIIKSPTSVSVTSSPSGEKQTQSSPISVITICLSLTAGILLCGRWSQRRKPS
jgi:hypothetical protein